MDGMVLLVGIVSLMFASILGYIVVYDSIRDIRAWRQEGALEFVKGRRDEAFMFLFVGIVLVGTGMVFMIFEPYDIGLLITGFATSLIGCFAIIWWYLTPYERKARLEELADETRGEA